MKKRWVIGVFVVLLLAIAFGAYYKLQLAPVNIDEVLPEGAALYLLSKPEKILPEIKKSRLWRNLKEINIEEILRKSDVGDGKKSQYLGYINKVTTFFSKLIWSKVFSKEIAVAVYPINITSLPPKTAAEVLSSIIIATRIKSEVKFVETIAKIYSELGKKVEFTQETYKKHKITVIPLTDWLNIYYTTIKDLLIIGADSKYIHLSIDTFNRRNPSLSQDAGYKWAKSQSLQSAYSMIYINLKEIINTWKKIIYLAKDNIPALGKEEMEEAVERIKELNGLEILSGYLTKDKNINSGMFNIKLNPDSLSPELETTLLSHSPEENKTLDFIPKNTLYYRWTNTLNIKEALGEIKKALSKKLKNKKDTKNVSSPNDYKKPEDIFSDIEKSLGYSFDKDIAPLIGNETGFAILDISTRGLFPIPKFFLFLEVNDTFSAERIMKDILNKEKAIYFKDENYKGIDINYLSFPIGANHFAYAFLDNYMIISSSKKLIEEIIDVYKNESPSIKENELFNSVDFGINGKNIFSSFVDMKNFIDKVEGILEWGLDWVSMRKEMQKSKARISTKMHAFLEEEAKKIKNDILLLEEKVKKINDAINYLKEQGFDVSKEEQELANLNMNIKEKKSTLAETMKRKNRYKQEIDKAQQITNITNKTQILRFYYDKIGIPILEGLKEIEACSSRTMISGKDMLKMMSYCKFE